MAEQLGTLARTHTCGALRAADVGASVVLLGWVQKIRDLGSLIFLDVRDRHGVTQVIVQDDEALLERAKRLRGEFVVAIEGAVDAARARDGERQASDRRDRGAGHAACAC